MTLVDPSLFPREWEGERTVGSAPTLCVVNQLRSQRSSLLREEGNKPVGKWELTDTVFLYGNVIVKLDNAVFSYESFPIARNPSFHSCNFSMVARCRCSAL